MNEIKVYDFERDGTFDRERLDNNKQYRGDNYTNAHNWFNQIEPFKFTYTVSCLDWFSCINVEINWNDFDSFIIERRYGPSWWLIGNILYDKENVEYSKRWHEISIGRIEDCALADFIIWCEKLCKYEQTLPIQTIKSIATNINILKPLKEIMELVDKRKEVKDNDSKSI